MDFEEDIEPKTENQLWNKLTHKAGVFCSERDDTTLGSNALLPRWTLKLTKIQGQSTNIITNDSKRKVEVGEVVLFFQDNGHNQCNELSLRKERKKQLKYSV